MIQIQPYNPEKDLNTIIHLLQKWRFKPYYYYRMIPKDPIESYIIQYFHKTAADITHYVIYKAETGNNIIGLAALKRLDWDSEIFGIKMAKIEYFIADETDQAYANACDALLSQILAQCYTEKILHVSIKVDTKDVKLVHLLEAKGFRLMDTLVVYAHELTGFKNEELKPSHLIRPFKQEDFQAMKNLASKVYSNSNDLLVRFYADPNLPKDECDRLYGEWFANSVKGVEADEVLIAELDRKPVGFITCKVEKSSITELLGVRIGYTPITAVSSEFRNQGVYTSLKKAAMLWLKPKAEILESRTPINNITVQKVWVNLGGYPINSHHTFHKWLATVR
jgi:hypothetical protein